MPASGGVLSECDIEGGFDLVLVDAPWENKSVHRGSQYQTLPNRKLNSLPFHRLLKQDDQVAPTLQAQSCSPQPKDLLLGMLCMFLDDKPNEDQRLLYAHPIAPLESQTHRNMVNTPPPVSIKDATQSCLQVLVED